jgi:hypothetical protein
LVVIFIDYHLLDFTTKGATNRVKLNQLDASRGPMVPVVNEFPNVFSEELPGMPPE